MLITSLTNPHIKNVVKLRDRRSREEAGLTVVDGTREVRCALGAGIAFTEIYFCPDVLEKRGEAALIREFGGKSQIMHEVTPLVLDKISFGDRREGIVAVCRTQVRTLKDIPVDSSLLVIVENVEKPGNVGAIIRSCDGAGVNALVISDPEAEVYNPNTIRSSLGTVFHLAVVPARPADILQFCRENEIRIAATSPAAGQPYFEQSFLGPVAFVVGSEQKGLEDFWTRHSDVQVRIPMRGRADSLNVSNAVAVLVYETLRQRQCRT